MPSDPENVTPIDQLDRMDDPEESPSVSRKKRDQGKKSPGKRQRQYINSKLLPIKIMNEVSADISFML